MEEEHTHVLPEAMILSHSRTYWTRVSHSHWELDTNKRVLV